MNSQNPNFNYGNYQNLNQINQQSQYQNLNPQFNNLNMNMYNQQIPQNNIYNSNINQNNNSNNLNMGYNTINNNINNFNNNPYKVNNNLPSINSIQNNFIDNNFRTNTINGISEKELKLKKQEEYRKILDEQIQNSNQRKEQNKFQYKNYESSNSFLNYQDNNNKTITKPYIDDKQKELERKKKMEYNEILRQQVEERKKREEMEKQKQKEEDIKFEVKIKQQLEERKIQEEYHKKLESLGKYNKNMESPDNIMYTNNPIPKNNPLEQQLFSSSPPQNLYMQNTINTNNNNTINNNLNINNNQISFPNNYIQQQMFNQQNNNYSNNNNFNNQNEEKYNYMNNQTYQTNNNNNNNYYNQRPLTQNYHNTLNNNNNDFYNEIPSNSNLNNNFNRTHSTRNQTMNIQNQQIRTNNINIEELFEKYVNDCQNLISQYENTMENFNYNPSLKKDNNDTIKSLINEKDIISNKIQNGQNELKNYLGFNFNLNEFNMKISKYLTLVLDRKIREIQEISKNYHKNKMYMNEYLNENKSQRSKNKNLNIFNTQISTRKKENSNILNNKNQNTIDSLTTSQINKQIMGCQYRSKYEDLRKSVFKNDDLNQDLKESLSGWSKLVTLQNESYIKNNPNANSNSFYKTWRKNKDIKSPEKNLEKIDEEKKENEIIYNIPQEDLLMSKKYIESNNVSRRDSNRMNENIISQTQNTNMSNNNKNMNFNNSNYINNNNNENNDNNDNIRRSVNSSRMSNKDNNISMDQIESSIKNINNNLSKNNMSKNNYINDNNNNNININTNNKSKKLDPRISAKIMDEKNLKISKEEKDKSVYFVGGQEQNSLMNNTNKIENSNMRISNELKNRKSFHGSPENINNMTRNLNSKDNIIINDLDDDSCNIDINISKKDENEKFEIINNPDLEKNKNKNNINNYKEIQESQKLQNQLNFFEDSMLENKVIKTSNKQKVRRPSSPKGKNSQSKKNEIDNNYNNNINNNELPADSLLSSKNLCNDSYGDNIINDLNKFRKLALEESSISNYKK